jgi:hypothetical protein
MVPVPALLTETANDKEPGGAGGKVLEILVTGMAITQVPAEYQTEHDD